MFPGRFSWRIPWAGLRQRGREGAWIQTLNSIASLCTEILEPCFSARIVLKHFVQTVKLCQWPHVDFSLVGAGLSLKCPSTKPKASQQKCFPDGDCTSQSASCP